MVQAQPKKQVPILLKVFFLLLLSTISSHVFATHFRYGNITWSRDALNPLKIHFKVTQAWRRGFPYQSYNPTNPSSANINVGSVIDFGSNYPLNFGDGTSTNSILTVTSISVADDWFIGVFETDHIYVSSPATRIAFFEGGARINGPLTTPPGLLQNNGGGTFRVETEVTLGNSNDAPVSTLPPFINMVVGQNPATYQIPATDPNGDALTFSLAPPYQFYPNRNFTPQYTAHQFYCFFHRFNYI
jgi:hypothetical protein